MNSETTQSSKEKYTNMTDEQYQQLSDREKAIYIAEELKKNRAREQELLKESRRLTKPNGRYKN